MRRTIYIAALILSVAFELGLGVIPNAPIFNEFNPVTRQIELYNPWPDTSGYNIFLDVFDQDHNHLGFRRVSSIPPNGYAVYSFNIAPNKKSLLFTIGNGK